MQMNQVAAVSEAAETAETKESPFRPATLSTYIVLAVESALAADDRLGEAGFENLLDPIRGHLDDAYRAVDLGRSPVLPLMKAVRDSEGVLGQFRALVLEIPRLDALRADLLDTAIDLAEKLYSCGSAGGFGAEAMAEMVGGLQMLTHRASILDTRLEESGFHGALGDVIGYLVEAQESTESGPLACALAALRAADRLSDQNRDLARLMPTLDALHDRIVDVAIDSADEV